MKVKLLASHCAKCTSHLAGHLKAKSNPDTGQVGGSHGGGRAPGHLPSPSTRM